MPAWVNILILLVGIIINGLIAGLAVWSLFPKSSKVAAYLLLERNHYDMYHRGTIVLKNLGPQDLLDAKFSKIPENSKWIKMFSFFFGKDEIAPSVVLSSWRESYFPSGSESRIFIGELMPSNEQVLEALRIDKRSSSLELLESFQLEYCPLRRVFFPRKMATAAVSVSFASLYDHLAFSYTTKIVE